MMRGYRFGPLVEQDGVRFRLWAPDCEEVALAMPGHADIPMSPAGEGFFEVLVPGTGLDTAYGFRIGELIVPDPASRCQREDAVGWSVVAQPLNRAGRANRRPWAESVICEVHVGTATDEGTFAALAARLPHYADAGYTALEILPVSDFQGKRGWGYDGVLPSAPDRAYGSPEDLVALVAAAHAHGLGIILDVVYNHFGPAGNYLKAYARRFFHASAATPWGEAIDFDQALVRRFFIENALMWIEDYGFDGLRFDAVHAFEGAAGQTFLKEMCAEIRAENPDAYLILESDANDSTLLDHRQQLYSAQWNDDFHHVLHHIATGETDGFYRDHLENPLRDAARLLAEGFVYQGEWSVHRDAPRGKPSAALHPTSFVSFIQNHDQVGNRAMGDRMTTFLARNRLETLRFLLMLAPQVPMLFMGEEWLAETPFPFFCDFEGELADAVRNGRKREFAAFIQFAHAEIPDPLAEQTFLSAKLHWAELEQPGYTRALEAFKSLVALRRRHVIPLLKTAFLGAEATAEGAIVSARWRFEGGSYALSVNLSDHPERVRAGFVAAPGVVLQAWSGMLWPDEVLATEEGSS